MIFERTWQMTVYIPIGKNFVEIPVSRTVSRDKCIFLHTPFKIFWSCDFFDWSKCQDTIFKQEESAREQALCQLTECF